MPRFLPALGSAAIIVVVAALALSFYVNRQTGIGVLPSPTPSVSPRVAAPPSVEPTVAPSFEPTAVPSPASAATSGSMWPQATLEEVQAAQALADAGDPRYTWQASESRGGYQPGQNHPHDVEFFARFLEEKLGWEKFLWHEVFPHLEDGDVVYVRCAAGGINPLYPDAAEGGCAPTLDELRYETVKVNVAQLVREGPGGIWVVTGWEMIEPFQQVAPASDAEITASLEVFLQARIDGEGAEGFVDFAEDDPSAADRVDQDIPLLYATSMGAFYERSEFEVVDGPVWPWGRTRFEVRLFAENGEAVVAQLFSLERDGAGDVHLVYDFQPMGPDGPVPATTENGEAVPVEYRFLDGEVTYRAAYPLAPSQDGYRASDRLAIVDFLLEDDVPRRVLLMLADPRPIGPDCVEAPAPADAQTVVQSIRSDPDFEATAPVAVTIDGIAGLRMDVVLTPGASFCPYPLLLKDAPVALGADRARLYLIDLPGGSARVLAIAVISDEDSLETVLEFAEPIIESIEFHAP